MSVAQEAKARKRWFQDTILKPARAKWGVGWDRLSEDVRRDLLYAQVGYVLLNSARLESGESETDGAYVRYAKMIQELMTEHNEEEG